MSVKPLKSHHIGIFKPDLAQPLIQREQRSSYALCLKQLHKQPAYTVGYISVSQTLNNNESIGMKVFNPVIDSDVAAEDRLWCLWQGGRELERYVEEFLELTNQVSWIDATLGVCFRLGLDDDVISCDLPTSSFSLNELVNHVLYVNGVSLEVEEIQSCHHPTPPENHQATPAHPSPGPSTYPTKYFDHPSLPSTVSVLSPETPPSAAPSSPPPSVWKSSPPSAR